MSEGFDPLGIQQLRAGEQFYPFAAEYIFQFAGGVGIEVVQDARAALYQGDLDAEPGEELGKLDRHSSAAKDDQRFGQRAKSKRGVAGKEWDTVELWQRRRSDLRAGSDDEIARGELFAGAQIQ